jgi:hypothetical protein
MLQSQRRICLLLDNFSGHKTDIIFSNVELVFITPGMTSVLQLLDCGIICLFKVMYKKLLVNLYLDMSDTEPIQKIDIKKAIDRVSSAWDGVTEETIANCWRHAGILSYCGLQALANAAV